MNIITTDKGYFRAGISGTATLTGSRVVFIGPIGAEQKTTLPEFQVRLSTGSIRDNCQLGRDFDIVD